MGSLFPFNSKVADTAGHFPPSLVCLADELVPEQEVSPVDGVEDEEEEGGKEQEESVNLCIMIVPSRALLPCLLL